MRFILYATVLFFLTSCAGNHHWVDGDAPHGLYRYAEVPAEDECGPFVLGRLPDPPAIIHIDPRLANDTAEVQKVLLMNIRVQRNYNKRLRAAVQAQIADYNFKCAGK